MAHCTITLRDGLDGTIDVGAHFEPPLAPGKTEGVYALGRRVLMLLAESREDGVKVHAPTESEA